MTHKQAAEILIKLSAKINLSAEEKEAVKIAIGVLSWTQLGQNRIKRLKARKDK